MLTLLGYVLVILTGRNASATLNWDLLITRSLIAWRDLEGCILAEHQWGQSWLNERRDHEYKSAANCEKENQPG